MNPEPDALAAAIRPVPVDQPALAEPAPGAPALSPEEVKALEVYFAQTHKDPSGLSALVGTWASGLLLHDVLKETLTAAEEEDGPPKETLPSS